MSVPSAVTNFKDTSVIFVGVDKRAPDGLGDIARTVNGTDVDDIVSREIFAQFIRFQDVVEGVTCAESGGIDEFPAAFGELGELFICFALSEDGGIILEVALVALDTVVHTVKGVIAEVNRGRRHIEPIFVVPDPGVTRRHYAGGLIHVPVGENDLLGCCGVHQNMYRLTLPVGVGGSCVLPQIIRAFPATDYPRLS